MRNKCLAILFATFFLLAVSIAAQQPAAGPAYKFEEVMIPMRDGVRLQTVIFTPVDQKGALPILFTRTPYGLAERTFEQMPPEIKELAQDGYIFVAQSLRGRFKSEGVFNISFSVDLNDPKATNEATDAYDAIEWLVKNVPNNNGKVGMLGVSYAGLTTAICLLHPHPALKAISEQASPADEWMNDDDHHFGALRESYVVEYGVMEQADRNKNSHFEFTTYDTYQWYLDLGRSPTSMPNTSTARFLTGTQLSNILTTTISGKRKPGSTNSTPLRFQTSTSLVSGIRKTRGVHGRSFAMQR